MDRGAFRLHGSHVGGDDDRHDDAVDRPHGAAVRRTRAAKRRPRSRFRTTRLVRDRLSTDVGLLLGGRHAVAMAVGVAGGRHADDGRYQPAAGGRDAPRRRYLPVAANQTILPVAMSRAVVLRAAAW